MKLRRWLPILLLVGLVFGLDAALLLTERAGDEDAREGTFAQAALRQRLQMMRDVHGRITPDGWMRAKAHADRMRARGRARQQPAIAGADQSPSASATAAAAGGRGDPWRWLGPNQIGGRIRTLAVHPTNPDVIFAGSAGGGIWKTTDGAGTWTPCDDFMPALSVSSIVFDPRNSNVIYASTGEGYHNGDALLGAGIFKSADGGLTWPQLPATSRTVTSDFDIVNRLAISRDGAVLLAATTYTGIHRSVDGGASFTNTSPIGQMTQVAFNPVNANEALAAGYSGGTLYSRDGGVTWSRSAGFAAVPASARVEFAYSRSDGSVYASVDVSGGSLYRSLDGGASFTLVSRSSLLGQQGWYDNAIWVNPIDANHVVVGGFTLSQSFDGGNSWTNMSVQPFHEDQHVIVEDPRFDDVGNRTVYVGNDGGVFRAADVRSTGASSSGRFERLNNGLGVTQFYGADGNPTSGTIIGGTQDNGSPRYMPASGIEWSQTSGGDLGFVVADRGDPNYFYEAAPLVSPYRTSTRGDTWESIGYGITDGQAANFIGPLALDPNNSQRFYAGRNNLWRTDAVKGPSPQFISVKPPTAAGNDYISAMAITEGNSNVVWVGHNRGDVYKTTNALSASPTWTRLGQFGSWVSRITIDPANPNEVFVTRTGFQSDNVQRTTDGGLTWAPAAGAGETALPPASVYDLEIDPVTPSNIYVGTDVGVFVSGDRGRTWNVEGSGPANTRVTELFLMGTTLVAATHGRGMFALDLEASSGAPAASVSPGSLTFGSQTIDTVSAAQTATVSNTGTAPLVLQTITRSGPHAADFQVVSDSCSNATVAAGSSCAIRVVFRPAGAGSRSASLVIADNAAGSPRSVPLAGTGAAQPAPMPSPWAAQDIGAVGVSGRSMFSNGTFTVSGAGADVWATADAFQFAFQPLTGDGTIVARVSTIQPVAPWTKAGVMIRQSLAPGAAHAFMIVSSGKGLAFQRRAANGGPSTSTTGPAGTAPRWVRLVRAGRTVTADISSNGTTWTTVGEDTIDLADTVYAGLVVSSHDATQLASATFDQVSVTVATPPPTSALPSGWATQDVGAVGAAGAASANAGVFTVSGAGADIWGTADAFRYAYYQLPTDGSIVARVASIENTAAWVKAGVMLRQTLSPDSAHALMLVSAGKGIAFQRRTSQGGVSASTPGGAAVAPRWVKLLRAGQTVSAYAGSDGVTWTLVDQDTIGFAGPIWAGLAVSSHDPARTATATFDSVAVAPTVQLPAGWQSGDIGSVGVPGSASASDGAFTVKGAGADVWGSSDGLHFAYTMLAGDGEVVARVSSMDNVHPWTKTGVMIRGSLSPSAPQAFMLVSSGKGLAFQRRPSAGGPSTSTPAGTGTAPGWVRLVREGSLITAYTSADGVAWTVVDQDTLAISGGVYVGLAVSSHDVTRAASAIFDGVIVR